MRPKSFINSISVYQKSLHPTSFWIGVSYHKITIFVYQKDDGINSASRALELVKEAVVIFKNAQVEPGILARSLYKRAQLLTCIVNAGRDKVSLKKLPKRLEASAFAEEGLPSISSTEDLDRLVQFDHR